MLPIRRTPAPFAAALAALAFAPAAALAEAAPAPATTEQPAQPQAVAPETAEQQALRPSVKLVAKPSAAFSRGHATFAVASTPSSRTVSLLTTGADALELKLARRSGGKTTRIAGAESLAIDGQAVAIGFGGHFAGRRLPSGAYKLSITPVRGKARGAAITVAVKLG